MNYKRDTRALQQPYKNRDYDYMQEILEEKHATTFNELMESLSKEEFRTMYITLGPNYSEKIRNVLYFNRMHERTKQINMPIWNQIRAKTTDMKPSQANIEWLHYMFQQNNIDILEFLAWFTIIAEKKLNKVNTLVLQGPTGSGKTLTLQSLLKKLNVATVTRGGDTNQFHFQNLLTKNHAIFEEPRISQATVDEYKLLLEGAEFEINVKNKDMQLLPRKPIFISTNRDIGYWVPPTDADALQARTKTFLLTKEIKGYSDRKANQSQINQPPGTITAADWLRIYEDNKEAVTAHVRTVSTF